MRRSRQRLNVTDFDGHPSSADGKSGSSFVAVGDSSYCEGVQIGTIASDWSKLLYVHRLPSYSFKPACTLGGASECEAARSSSHFTDFDSYLQHQCNYPQVSLSRNLDYFSKIR